MAIFNSCVSLPEGIAHQKFKHSHGIHGAAIYGNMDPINIPPLC